MFEVAREVREVWEMVWEMVLEVLWKVVWEVVCLGGGLSGKSGRSERS